MRVGGTGCNVAASSQPKRLEERILTSQAQPQLGILIRTGTYLFSTMFLDLRANVISP